MHTPPTQYALTADGQRDILVNEEALRWLLRSAKAAWQADLDQLKGEALGKVEPDNLADVFSDPAQLRHYHIYTAELANVEQFEQAIDDEDDDGVSQLTQFGVALPLL